ncbi:MAG: amidohydrolase [Alcaligenaceae bacterium]|nr:amidohydrolase [Alcaligenaceae bacterium SAGV5]MPS54917.1 amidohydrolase [Alcaligenaceae bacterium SAGV3]MPT59180.1 amidohydrolase [Alcaligenaceae bacterium]
MDTRIPGGATETAPLPLPRGACDAHVHVVGPASRFPFVAGRHADDAPKEALFALHRRLGIDRCVVVQSASHGFDNSAVEDAIRAGEGRYLGVAAVPPDVADGELRRLADAGFRGVRFNFMSHLASHADPRALPDFSKRLAPLGMHLQLHFAPERIHELAPLLRGCSVQVMIDHMGRVDATQGPTHAHFGALCELLRDERFWVKVSGVDRVSPPGGYADGVALARGLMRDFPDRCVWGTDWPHTNHSHRPEDEALVGLLAGIAPTRAALEKLLVGNPMNFYRFAA